MPRSALLVALLFAAQATLAADPCAPQTPPLHMSHVDSNDALTPPVVGDETLCATLHPGTEWVEWRLGERVCRVSRWIPVPPGPAVQRRTTPALPQPWWSPYETNDPACWPTYAGEQWYRLWVCNSHGCVQATNGPVGFQRAPYACFRAGVGEELCPESTALVYAGRVRP